MYGNKLPLWLKFLWPVGLLVLSLVFGVFVQLVPGLNPDNESPLLIVLMLYVVSLILALPFSFMFCFTFNAFMEITGTTRRIDYNILRNLYVTWTALLLLFMIMGVFIIMGIR
jgi:hypothetical protein